MLPPNDTYLEELVWFILKVPNIMGPQYPVITISLDQAFGFDSEEYGIIIAGYNWEVVSADNNSSSQEAHDFVLSLSSQIQEGAADPAVPIVPDWSAFYVSKD